MSYKIELLKLLGGYEGGIKSRSWPGKNSLALLPGKGEKPSTFID